MTAAAQTRQRTHRSRGYRPPKAVVLTSEGLLGELTPLEDRHAPSRLWVAGDQALARSSARVSIVGSRKASPEGERRAAKLAAQLARAGVVVVSGLADGIDGAAHRATIESGGRTIAVIGTAIDRCYPKHHAELQTEIYSEHLLISQFDPDRPTYPSGFVKRNRFMALISQLSVVVEAGDSSGTLSQAAETMRLGRPLFIMRSVVERSDLAWPARFLAGGAQILDDVAQVLGSVGQRAIDGPVTGSPVDVGPLVLPGCEVS